MNKEKIFNGEFYCTKGSYRIRNSGNIELRVRYYGHDGKIYDKSFSAPSLEKCYTKATQFWYEYNDFLCRPDSTIYEILEAKFANDLRLNFIKEQTYYKNVNDANPIKRHLVGQIPIRDVTKELIEDFLEEITKYASSTIDTIFIDLKMAFRIAKNEEIVAKDIMQSRDIRKPKSSKVTKKMQALTIEEQELVLNDFRTRKLNYGSNDYRNQLLIQLYSGMRMGEVNALTPEDIDFDNNVIHVRNTVIKINGKPQLGDTTKTFAGYRDIPISKALRPVLEQALSKMKPNDLNLVFYDFKNDGPFNTNVASRYFSRVCNRVGIEPRGSHSLRHTFATRCIEAGVPAVVLKKWLGHTDIHVTLDTYADVFDRMHNDAVDKLDIHLDALNNEDI